MSAVARCLFALVLLMPARGSAEGWLDRVHEHLAFGSRDGTIRARISGSVELEAYAIQDPVSDLVFSARDFVNPRLVLYLDAQVGRSIYLFGQARVDRRFDPTDKGSLRPRLDELAVRWTPGGDQRFTLQAGQFATVVGQWPRRHAAWENAFITAPMPYDNLLGIWDRAAPDSVETLLEWSHVRPASDAMAVHADKNQRLPIIWGPSYTSGVAIAGVYGHWDYAVEVKNASLSSRPKAWNDGGDRWDHPTVSGRVGWRPDPRWNLGLSASSGSYLAPEARPTLAPGSDFEDYRQLVVAHDVSFAWHHLQVWGELHAARFELPGLDDAKTVAYFVEAKYKLGPQWFLALRWNQQLFGRIEDAQGREVKWGRDAWRIDFAPGYRFSPHVQLKVQFSLRHETPAPRELTHSLATQLTIRF